MAKKKASKRWTEAVARQVLEHAARSGLSDRGYARREGFDPQRLWWWRKRLGDTQVEAELPKLVEVKARASTLPEVVEVRLLNGRVVRMPTTIEPSNLAALLDAIEGRGC